MNALQEEVAEQPEKPREMLGSVLVLDDEPTVLASLRTLFHGKGFECQYFVTAAQALLYLEQHAADIVIADLRMPVHSGQEFLARVMSLCPDSNRIIMSGYDDKDAVMDVLSSGVAQEFVHKPWKNPELLTLITDTLELRRELRKRELLDLITGFPNLPASSISTMQLAASITTPDVGVNELVETVELEPTLVAKLLRVANSVYFGARTPISGIRDAISFIGTEYVVGLILGYHAFQNVVRQHSGADAGLVDVLWKRALHRAHIAKTLALGWEGVRNPHIPYAVALLQDIGFVVWACAKPELFGRFHSLRKEARLTWREAEDRIFVAPHEEVGSRLLQTWNFPDRFVKAVAGHHGAAHGDPLISIVELADLLETGEFNQPHDPALDVILKEWRNRPIPES